MTGNAAQLAFAAAVTAEASRLQVDPQKAARLVYLHLEDPADLTAIPAALAKLVEENRLVPAPAPHPFDPQNPPRLGTSGVFVGGPQTTPPAVATIGTDAQTMPRLGQGGLFRR